jgi:hypothetical protein
MGALYLMYQVNFLDAQLQTHSPMPMSDMR